MTGSLKAHFDATGKIDLLDLTTTSHQEFVPRKLLRPVEPSPIQSPKLTKAAQKKKLQAPPQPPKPSISVPESKVTNWGVTAAVLNFLEVGSVSAIDEELANNFAF